MKITEQTDVFIEAVTTSYTSLKGRVEDSVAYKAQRENFGMLQRSLQLYTWAVETLSLIVEYCVETKWKISSEHLQPLIKVLGLLNTRAKKNETKAVVELLQCFSGSLDRPTLLNRRETKLASDQLSVFLENAKVTKQNN